MLNQLSVLEYVRLSDMPALMQNSVPIKPVVRPIPGVMKRAPATKEKTVRIQEEQKETSSICWLLGRTITPSAWVSPSSSAIASVRVDNRETAPRSLPSPVMATPTSLKLHESDSIIRTDELLQIDWTAIVLDESTRIKNPRALVTKRMMRWTALRRTPLKAILTGIPAPQSYEDLWCQMAWLNDGAWMGCGNFWRWRDVYTRTAGFARYFPTKQLAIVKRAVHDEAIILTRKQAGLANEKIKQKRVGELHPQALKLYRSIVKNWEVPGIECKHSITVTGWLRRLTGGFSPVGPLPCWKYDELARLMVEDLADEKVVVWFAYNKEIDRAKEVLTKARVEASIINGSVDPRERPEIIRGFRKGGAKALLIQVKCGKYGLDLSTSDTAIYFSNSDSYENRAQSEDRIEHMGKKSPLLYLDLVTERTVDEDVIEALAEKRCDSAYLASKAFMNRRAG